MCLSAPAVSPPIVGCLNGFSVAGPGTYSSTSFRCTVLEPPQSGILKLSICRAQLGRSQVQKGQPMPGIGGLKRALVVVCVRSEGEEECMGVRWRWESFLGEDGGSCSCNAPHSLGLIRPPSPTLCSKRPKPPKTKVAAAALLRRPVHDCPEWLRPRRRQRREANVRWSRRLPCRLADEYKLPILCSLSTTVSNR